ncbi:MAG: phage portal protein [Nocardioides sp.]
MAKLPPARSALVRIVDGVYSALWPREALLREHARRMLASNAWPSTSRSRSNAYRSFVGAGGSPLADNDDNLAELREQSRGLVRGNPIAAGAILGKVGPVIGVGLSPNAAPMRKVLGLTDEQAEELSSEMETQWRLHADSLDFSASRDANAAELLGRAFQAMLESGDALLVRRSVQRKGGLFSTCWTLIEGDRLCNPDGTGDTFGDATHPAIVSGVEFAIGDTDGTPVAYHVCSSHPGDYAARSQTWSRIPARDADDNQVVLHLARKARPGQVRGIPDLAPVIEILGQCTKLNEAELQSAVIGALMAVAVTTKGAEGIATGVNPSFESTTSTDGHADEKQIPAGAMFDLDVGEDIKQIESNRPSPLIEPFLMALYRQIGPALQMPVEVLIKHFQSSYSAARAALADFWDYVLRERFWLACHVCAPWYAATISEAVARKYLDLPGFFSSPLRRAAWLNVGAWLGTAQPQLDPLKEVNAAQARVDGLFSNREIEAPSLVGQPWETIVEGSARERAKIRKLGLPTGKQIGESIETESTANRPGAPVAPSHDEQPGEDDVAEGRRG